MKRYIKDTENSDETKTILEEKIKKFEDTLGFDPAEVYSKSEIDNRDIDDVMSEWY
ncbi:MAG: hypothetical protein LBD62_04335 [Candidatus Margulisbacteria bacterium]|jgi:hypothetical protein|nr:hypothetical protein [Candidatus Margulisiibacteriota bacterium]